MMPVLFLDEASRHVGSMDRSSATESAKDLISVLKRLRKVNKNFSLNTERHIAHYRVSDEWTLGSLLGGIEFKEEWEFIRALSSQSPLGYGLDHLSDEINGLEFKTKSSGIPSLSLAWATVMDTAIVSFDSHSDWSEPFVEAAYLELDDDCNVQSHETFVRNACKIAHVLTHSEWFSQLLGTPTEDPSELWKEREARFPSIRFLPRVENDLSKLSTYGAPFRQALQALATLSNDAQKWPEGAASPSFSTKATPEGETGKRRCWVFDDRTGNKELFDWHIRFTGSIAGRIHFRIDGANREIVVAYMGAKLSEKITG
jgi:hypothetical protein